MIEPILRCDACESLVHRKYLSAKGMCKCGNRRVTNIKSLSEEEHKGLLDGSWNIGLSKETYMHEKVSIEEFASLFEGVEEDEI